MQPRTTIPLTELVPLYRQMTDRTWSDNRLCGALHVSDQATVELLSELLHEDNADNYPCIVEQGDEENIQLGDQLFLKFGRVRTGVGILFPDLASLLQHSGITSGTANLSWYLVDLDEASWEDKGVSKRLNLIERLVQAFEGTASILDTRNNRLVFLRDGQCEVPLQFDSATLLGFNESIAEEVIQQLSLQDGHIEQRHEICATAICEMLSNIPKELRFSSLLSSLDDFKQRFVDGYKLFASSFSFKKIRDQAEAIRIEYLGKIHKTFSDIQGQLLGIPVSTIIIATQFKDVEALTGTLRTGQAWINIAVLVGAFIFCLFFTLSVLNQKHTLDVIDEEIKRHKISLENEYADIKDRLEPIFTKLTDRSCLHRGGLWMVMIICWASFAFGTAVFWSLTSAAF
ncbi:hypothetical protein [Oceanisphaera sp. KMM 10153]|uniref:hypothetical protein n=1 Tax=Oceanisphaera submarina TaxID=3390193 RepID=UPI0039752E5E